MDLFTGTDFEQELAFPTSYDLILERMGRVKPVQYARTRNYIRGDVTYLSPYISRGVISVKKVMDSVIQAGYKRESIEKFLQELAWREYYQRVWQYLGDKIGMDIKQPQPEVLHHQTVTSVEKASTGIHALDDQIRHLYETGYMHNHCRMYTAALVCNMGKAHWLQPARWMYYHLLDGDIASNHCSWQWVAGAFSSKKYYFNQENIDRYTGTPQKNSFLDQPYERITTMEIPDSLRETSLPNLHTELPVTPLPVLNPDLPTLIYNSYNLDPLWRKDEEANRVLLLEPSHFLKYPVNSKLIRFLLGLSTNIKNIQVFTGETDSLTANYGGQLLEKDYMISKEHPAFTHYPGRKDERDWMFPEVNGYYPSFFAYWKKCEKYL